MRGEPKLGVEYEVQAMSLPDGVDDDAESMVPVRYQGDGLVVDVYGPSYDEDGENVVFDEDSFIRLIDGEAVIE